MFATDPSAAPAAIPPELAALHRPADRYGFFDAAGARLRVARWTATGIAKGMVVVLGGRGEFIEKYATEVVGELLDRGFAVEAMDWRGQGLSDRLLPDRGKGHIDDFATYVADLKLYFETIVAPAAQGPTICIAHSMGAHTLIRYLGEHGNGPLSGAVLTAPMSGLKREGLLKAALFLMPNRPSVEARYLYGSGPFALTNRSFAINRLTHDERRFHFTDRWFDTDPRLSLGGPTVGWARQALKSIIHATQPGFLEGIDLPVTVVSAGEDRLVEPRTHETMVTRLKDGELVLLHNSLHEVMMEHDEIRGRFWEAFDRLAKSLAA